VALIKWATEGHYCFQKKKKKLISQLQIYAHVFRPCILSWAFIHILAVNGIHYVVVAEGGGALQGSPPPAGRVFANRTQPFAWEGISLQL
jgi:hypothetical protein